MNLGSIEWLAIALVALVLALGLVGRSWLGQRRWRTETWAKKMGLELTTRNEPFVRSYVTRTRSLRLAGGLIGLLIPIVYSAYTDKTLPVPVDFGLLDALLGYLLGALLAEVTIKRPKAEVPSASLVPRNLSDYLPRLFTITLRAAAAVAVALVPLYRILRARENVDVPAAIVMLPTILVILVAVELLQRYVVARPQPAVERDLMQADAAVRSASVHALAGAGIALELLIVSVHVGAIAFASDIQLLRWTLPWVALVCFGVALGSWFHLAQPYRQKAGGIHQEVRG